jgi:hypothetical protein
MLAATIAPVDVPAIPSKKLRDDEAVNPKLLGARPI